MGACFGRKLERYFARVLVFLVILTLFPITAFAAGLITFNPNAPSYVVGEPVNISINSDDGGFPPNSRYYLDSGVLPPGMDFYFEGAFPQSDHSFIVGKPTAVGTYTANMAIDLGGSGGNNTGSITITVTQASTTIAVSTSPSPAKIGQAVILTAAISPVAPSTVAPSSGSVEFFDGATSLGTGMVNNSGIAVFTTSTLSLGAHNSITAVYAGDSNYSSSTSAGIALTINKADPIIIASNDTATLGAAKTVTATLAEAYLAGTDSISFTATSGAISVPATAAANGSVNFNLSAANINALGAGTHTFTIAQTSTAGNAATNNNTVVSTTFDLTINGAPTITSANSYICTAGTGGTFQVVATGNPSTFTYSLTGAPAGVTINPASGLITVASTVTANTYNFTVGADNGVNPSASQAFTLTVQQPSGPNPPEPTNAYVSPASAIFDKYTANANYKDIPVTLASSSYTLSSITLGGNPVAATNYAVSGNQFTFKKEYLATLGTGTQVFTFNMNGGTSPTFAVTISDSTPGTAITGLPKSYTLYTGGRVNWTPQPAGGTWSYDKTYLSMTKSGDKYTFKALKVGNTIATYTVNGVSHTVSITINESILPQTGDNGNITSWIIIMLAALCGAVAVVLYRKKKEHADRA